MCVFIIAGVIIVAGFITHMALNWGDWHDDDFGHTKGYREGIHYD